MSLKILFIPFSFIMILVLSIGYIKPLYQEFLLKQAVYLGLEQQRTQVNDRLGNINAVLSDFSSDFSETLDGKGEREVLIDQYIPEAIDQDRVVDAFNYLAGQAGVSISSVVMSNKVSGATANAAAQDQIINSQSLLLNGAGTAEDIAFDSALALKANYPAPKKYEAKLTLNGNYESFTAFLNLIYRMNRENEVESFILKKSPETKNADGTVEESSLLVGDLSVLFMYYPGLTNASIQNAEALDVFSSGKIDTKALTYIQEKTQASNLPELVIGSFSARANPFVK